MARKANRVKAARLKLTRASKHLKAIKRYIADYSSGRPFEVISGQTEGKKITKVKIRKAPPPEISILSGEMIYQMRSALDHLAFGLVERNTTGKLLPLGWEERCEFPLRATIPKINKVPCKLPAPYSVFSHCLPEISKTAFEFIEHLQPYYRVGKLNNTLGFLATLSNIDKHRYLNVVGVRISRRQTIRYASGLSLEGFDTFDHGAKFQTETRSKPDRAVYVNRRFGVAVHFDELALSGGAVGLPVDYILHLMLEQIRTVVFPAFNKFITEP